MSIFDDLGKKVKDAGHKSVQKTREISEISQINTMISQAESSINRTYFEIGKTYVSLHSEDSEEALASMVSSVIKLENEIEKYKKQIQQIRGIQVCSQCGAELSRGSAFCSSCGAPVPKIQKPQYNDDLIQCDSCGAMVKKGMRFCTACGNPLAISRPVPEVINGSYSDIGAAPPIDDFALGNESEESNDVSSEPETKACPKCGKLLTPDSIFCPECGFKL